MAATSDNPIRGTAARVTLLSCLFFTGQPCIPGAKRVVMWQPTDTWAHDDADVMMIHVEKPLGTKADQLAVQKAVRALIDASARAYPTVPVVWYAPDAPRSDVLAAKNGDKAAAARLKEWESRCRDMALMGLPPKGCGVFIDCYDFTYLASVWKERVAASIRLWQSLGYDIIPIITLRWLDTMLPYDEATARERINYLASLCGGRVCIYDDGVDAQGRKMNYADWSLRPVVESIARAA